MTALVAFYVGMLFGAALAAVGGILGARLADRRQQDRLNAAIRDKFAPEGSFDV